jgi:hypothetical protein
VLLLHRIFVEVFNQRTSIMTKKQILSEIKALGFIVEKSNKRTSEYIFTHIETKKQYVTYKTGYVRFILDKYCGYEYKSCVVIYKDIATEIERLEKILKYFKHMIQLKRL